MKIFDPKLTGSIEILNTIQGNVTIAGGLNVEGSLGGAVTASATASYVEFTNIANKPTLLSGSSQIASDISGSFTSLSSSLASELLKNTTDTLDGDLTVTGTLTAQEFHTEFVSASIIYESGSTQFGNSSDDTHVFTGTGSFDKVGIGTTIPLQLLQIQDTNGDFSAEATIRGALSTGTPKAEIAFKRGTSGDGAGLVFRASNSSGTLSDHMVIKDSSGHVGIGTNDPTPKLHLQYSNGTYTAESTSGFINEATTGRGTMRIRSAQDEAAELFYDINGAIRWDVSVRNSVDNYSMRWYPTSNPPSLTNVGGSVMQLTQDGKLRIGGDVATIGILTIAASATDDLEVISITENGTDSAFAFNANLAGTGETNNNLRLNSFWHDDIMVFRGDGNIGIGTSSPVSTLDISTQLSGVQTVDYPLTLTSRDDGNSINQLGGEGVGIRFRLAGNDATTPGNSFVGAGIAAIRAASADDDSTTDLAFYTSQNDENLDETVRINSVGNVGIGTNVPSYPLHLFRGTTETLTPTYVDGYYTGVQDVYINNSRASYASNGRGTRLILGAGGSVGGFLRHITYGSVGNAEVSLGVQRSGGAGTIQTAFIANNNSDYTVLRAVGSSTASVYLQDSAGSNHVSVKGSTGYVGIGTTAPSSRLQVHGNLSLGQPGNGGNTDGRFISLEGNTDGSGEGSARIFFAEHNSSTAQMDHYGFSIGYRGGATSITGASGNTWTGLSQIGNGQWGMWGHGNDATGALIMYGDRNATFVNFSGNDVSGIGTLSKSSGTFNIEHPLESKAQTHRLVHSFVESPQANNIYRGRVNLIDGQATVNLDIVSSMTEGTFVALNRDVHSYVSNESDWDAVRSKVEGNILTIECQNTSSTATVTWLVVGERHDPHIIQSDITDENGSIIVEPEIS